MLSATWVYLGTGNNWNARRPTKGSKYPEQKRECSLLEEKGGWKGCSKQRAHWRKPGAGSVAASHWSHCDSLSLAELLPGGEKTSLPPGAQVCPLQWGLRSALVVESPPSGVGDLGLLPGREGQGPHPSSPAWRVHGPRSGRRSGGRQGSGETEADPR